MIAVLPRDPDPEVVQEVALWAVDLPPSLAEELAHHPHVVVRAEFAKNRHAPPALLASLLADGGRPAPTSCDACHPRAEGCADHAPGVRRIRLAAATNPAVPPAGRAPLTNLVERHGPPVYGAVARNPGCPGALLRRMARDADSVRKALRAIAVHPALPADVVEELLTDPDPRVVQAAAAHPALPVATMERLLAEAAGN